MASLMTLTNAHAAEIRRGRWMVISKYPERADYSPAWHMMGIDAVAGDYLMLSGGQDQRATLEAISCIDPHARVFSVRETEPIKTIFTHNGSVKTLCEEIRWIYDEQLGLSLPKVMLVNGGVANAEAV